MKKKALVKIVVLSFMTTLLVVLTAVPLVAQYPRFFVCMVNNTNKYINYNTQWCTRAGSNCSGYRRWTISPNSYRRHWGAPGNGKMTVKIHTGGSGGVVRTYNFYGTTSSCRDRSTYHIRYNDRGFLRVFKY